LQPRSVAPFEPAIIEDEEQQDIRQKNIEKV